MLPGISPLSGALGGGAAGSPPPYGGGTDPDFANVVLLLGFQDVNNATGSPGMDDESPSTHGTLTVVATSDIDTTQKRFGSSSLNLTGGYVYFDDDADFHLSSGDFTVEMWVRPGSTASPQFLVGQWNSAPNFGWILWMNGSKLAWNTSTTGTNNNFDMEGATTINTDTWYHFCVDYDGTKYRLYVDGVMDDSFSTPRTLHDSNLRLAIGGSHNGSFALTPANVQEVRITKGVARYADDGGFVVPTDEFPRQ